MTEKYIDHSPSALINEQANVQAQTFLQKLGYDIKADGDWGPASQAAAADWQRINNYYNPAGEITGDITTRQMAALEMQAADPSIFQRFKNAGFYENFDTSSFDDLGPVRSAVLLQAASHIGVTESGVIPGTDEGNNAGVDVENYLGEYHMEKGNAWCASFTSWTFDQIEKYAGEGKNSFVEGSPSVNSMLENIEEAAPDAIKRLDKYKPQGGDIFMMIHPDGTGHVGMAAASLQGNGMTAMVTIEGNSGDSVQPNERAVYTDPETGRNFFMVIDAENPEASYVDYETEIVVIDVEELPGFERMQNAFNSSAGFVPTAPADPGFSPDIAKLDTLTTALAAYDQFNQDQAAANAPQAMDPNMAVQPDTPGMTR